MANIHFKDYEEAAYRHAITGCCLVQQINSLSKKESGGGINKQEETERRALLENLYYLSGYVLECAYSYVMCYEEDRRHPFTNDVKTQLDSLRPYNYRICYSNNKKSTFGAGHSIVRLHHKMSIAELSFFSVSTNSGLYSSIFLIGGQPFLDLGLQALFDNWTAYERYKIDAYGTMPTNTFTEKNVLNFFWALVEICQQMYQKTNIPSHTKFSKILKQKK